jgi:2-oxoglutarate dehydrogenase E2 component (dihydrolipoamide succinyltransferase)
MPKMGESIQEGKVLRWVKKPGDKVERDEVLLEISTDKVDTEVPSPSAGTLVEVLAAEGDVVEVGKVIARLSSGAAAPAPAPAPVAVAPVPAPVASPAPAPAAAAAPAVSAPVAHISGAATSSIPRQSGARFYSPLVRSIAAAEGVSVQELDSITGTGLEGRVTKNDIMGYLSRRGTGAAAAPVAAAPAAAAAPVAATVDAFPTLNIPAGADTEIIPMDRVRQLIAEHMVRSKHTSPHVTSIAEADVTGIVKLRNKVKDTFGAREGFKLTFNPFFGYAVCEGVKAFPRINVSVDGKNIIQHRRVNLGMATALPDGNLIVPVIKGAENLNVTGVARMMNDLANKARTKKLSPDDIAGGTITVTNVGSFGSLFGTPVINQPQTAIVGVGAIQKRPVVRELDGEDVIVVRSMVYLSITYDHRVIDGALATQALAAMVRALESINESNTTL